MKFALSIASLLVLGVGAYGCSDDAATGDDTGDDDGGASSSSSGGGSSSSSGGSSSGGSSSSSSGSASDAGACPDFAAGAPFSTKNQLAHSGDCTAEQLTAFDTACVAEESTAATCTAFSEANAQCDNCISGNGDPATRVTGFIGSDGEVSPVCPANVAGNPAECGSKADNLAFCVNQVCEACGTDAEYDACLVSAAAAAPCNAFVPAVDCDALFAAHEADITETCGDGDIADMENANKFAAYMCGPAD